MPLAAAAAAANGATCNRRPRMGRSSSCCAAEVPRAHSGTCAIHDAGPVERETSQSRPHTSSPYPCMRQEELASLSCAQAALSIQCVSHHAGRCTDPVAGGANSAHGHGNSLCAGPNHNSSAMRRAHRRLLALDNCSRQGLQPQDFSVWGLILTNFRFQFSFLSLLLRLLKQSCRSP